MRRSLAASAAIAVALTLALALGLRSGRFHVDSSRETAIAAPVSAAPAPAKDPQPDSPAAGAAPAPGDGFRLLDAAEAAARDAKRATHPWTAYLSMSDEVMRAWSEVSIDLNFTDAPLQEILAWLTQRYGLIARLDPAAVAKDVKVTFKVSELAADQAFDLILKMADLRWFVGLDGELWISPRDGTSACEPPFFKELGQALRDCSQARGPVPSAEPGLRDAEARGRLDRARFDGSIVRQPIQSAVEQVAGRAEVGYRFTRAAREVAGEGALGTIVGEGLSVPAALQELLSPAGLGYRIEWGRVLVMTEEEIEADAEAARVAAEVELTNLQETAKFRARVVRLTGEALSVTDVARQAGDQLGIPVFVDPLLFDNEARWAADGSANTMGEVLDALTAGAPLTWSWQALYEFVDDKVVDRGWRLWLFSAKSK